MMPIPILLACVLNTIHTVLNASYTCTTLWAHSHWNHCPMFSMRKLSTALDHLYPQTVIIFRVWASDLELSYLVFLVLGFNCCHIFQAFHQFICLVSREYNLEKVAVASVSQNSLPGSELTRQACMAGQVSLESVIRMVLFSEFSLQ